MEEAFKFQVNNQDFTVNCHPGTSLLTLLRQLGWFGVHRGCDRGDCGACTVWVNDIPIHSCIYPAMRIANQSVTTIEGLSENGELAPMQQAFLQGQGFQCGFCTPGMIMSAAKLPFASPEELRLALKGNLCRCTGYQAIIESILPTSPSPSLHLSDRVSPNKTVQQLSQAKHLTPQILCHLVYYILKYCDRLILTLTSAKLTANQPKHSLALLLSSLMQMSPG
ncbi:(2Fe-2S)-binding protein [Fischerella sp.]|jgi:aerobic-type carbon monoxide dehydrogenase small subunit (CoxS/CutS family)|uniref:(2Fe-2S)-binding protein n=1 Tax=Fischerella sp. TaxID=1191 RepID=UPI0025C0244F|nr:(2Fe-2S)-binding protein [Fischerella sp.]